jgi:hypothetical protein
LGEGAIDVGGGGEVRAERFEGGHLKSRATCTTTGFCFQGVLAAELCTLVAAAPPIGKSELATQGIFTRSHIWNLRFQRRGCVM